MEQLELKKESIWEFETTNFTISDKKCGEIFVQTNEKFYIVCTFCIIRFPEFDQFTTHYSHNHASESASSFINPLDFIKTELDDNLVSNAKAEEAKCDENIENAKPIEIFDETIRKDKSEFTSKQEIISPVSEENKKSRITIKKKSKRTSTKTKSKQEKNTKGTFKKKIVVISPLHQQQQTASKKNVPRKIIYNYSCDSCERTFTTETHLENHKKYDHLSIDDPFVNMSTDTKSNACKDDLENNKDNRTKFIQQIKVDPKKCRYCNRKFGSRYDRIEHERVNHTGERPFKCKHCDKNFASLRCRTQHEKFHLGIRPHKCNICGASFVIKGSLATHLRRHKGEKSHSCSFCEKKFFDNAEKVIHERTHTGEKPYQCITCGKCFTTSSHMFHHRKLHHSTDVAKPHTCEICNKGFVTKGMLKEHCASHSDVRRFKCEICDKKFKYRKGLKSHEKIHSDATNYTCNICGKGFKQYSGLYCHAKVHEKKAT